MGWLFSWLVVVVCIVLACASIAHWDGRASGAAVCWVGRAGGEEEAEEKEEEEEKGRLAFQLRPCVGEQVRLFGSG